MRTGSTIHHEVELRSTRHSLSAKLVVSQALQAWERDVKSSRFPSKNPSFRGTSSDLQERGFASEAPRASTLLGPQLSLTFHLRTPLRQA